MDLLRAFIELIARRKIWSLFIFVAVITGTIYSYRLRMSFEGIESATLQRGNIIDAVYAIGTVTVIKRLTINPLIGNNLRETYVREGDRVKKGAPLIALDPGITFRAPFDGVVNYAPYRVGENTVASVPLMVFTDMSHVYVVATMEQQGALRIKVGQIARISFDSLRGEVFEGKVSAVYSYANNFLARIDSVNLPDFVLPDMTCDVAIVVEEKKDVLLIPIAAFDSGQVWVKRGHKPPFPVPVQLGVNDGLMSEVISGDLHPGDHVMIRKEIGP
jgi:multidrug efflux pump subunit AcrA (membrane-fusion protein)